MLMVAYKSGFMESVIRELSIVIVKYKMNQKNWKKRELILYGKI